MECYLFDRRTICYADERTAYYRDVKQHKWVECRSYYFDLMDDFDSLIEVVEYDEEKEQILALSRRKGCWVSKSLIESREPSSQVTDFLERTGITYEDLYVEDKYTSGLFLSMPDLIEGAPGSEKYLKELRAKYENTDNYLAGRKVEEAKNMYEIGEYEKAFPVFEEYANKGVAEAQIQIGRCYEYGNGVARDEAKAVEWYKKAVDQDYDEGWCCLACCYELGIGIDRNYPKAAELYTIAAERGHPRAQNNLGSLYETGRGVEKNIKTALMWYNRAAEGGNKTAKRNLRRLGAEDFDNRSAI